MSEITDLKQNPQKRAHADDIYSGVMIGLFFLHKTTET